ncbi:protein FAR1-RELATED SEQUENCE 5-like [Tasmannia lanceolata]
MPAARIAKAINSTNDGISGVVTPDQVASHLRKKRVNNIGQEAVLVANHLQNKRSEDPNFFFSMELDTDGTFRSMFWADARARDAYITFSDVIVFDVTYKTNRLSLPFAPFTGVNHHRQSTLFGCALLADETEETFSWLFEQWLTCMHGKAPDAIITDMDPAMKNAIGRVFPDTHHRFCSWHIHRHLLEHVAEMRDSTSKFCLDYNRWYFSKNIEDCEQLWEDLVCNYEIGDSDWLSRMWEQREHWVPAYWRNTFTAGMTSSQRSESMNAFFDGYVNSKTSLHEFLDACDRALVQRRKTEAEEDFKSKYSKASMKTNSPLEEEAGIFYTRNMFNIFQDELRDSSGCWHDQLSKDGAVEEYLVGLRNDVKSRWCRVFYYDSDGMTFKCDCAKFEREGILCKHIFRIMDMKQLKKVPDHYMLKRWSIQAMYQVGGTISTRPQVGSSVNPFERWCLISRWQRLVDGPGRDEKVFKRMTEFCDILFAEEEQKQKENEVTLEASEIPIVGSEVYSNFAVSQIAEITIRDPPVAKTKGRPKNPTRLKSGLETSISEPKKRTCQSCGGKGHYKSTCKNKSQVLLIGAASVLL